MKRIGGFVKSKGEEWAWNIMPMTVHGRLSYDSYYIWRSQTIWFSNNIDVRIIRALDSVK